jgi:hypothetical protein
MNNPRPLCPCGSGKQVNKCCLPSVRGYWRTGCNITPPPPQTNYAHPKCFLAVTKDCSQRISREHYLSEGVLEEIDFMIGVEGLSWIPAGQNKHVSRSNLTAHFLCDRHNSALSPLDRQGIAFFHTVKQYAVAAYDGRERVSAFNGRDIERWMLKTLYGMLASKLLQAKVGVRIDAEIDSMCVDLLYDRVPFIQGRGLFVRTEIGHTIETEKSIAVQPVTNNLKGTLNGIRFNIVGFDFLLTTSRVDAEHSAFRPGYIVFSSSTGFKVIHLFWTDPGPHPIVRFVNRK